MRHVIPLGLAGLAVIAVPATAQTGARPINESATGSGTYE